MDFCQRRANAWILAALLFIGMIATPRGIATAQTKPSRSPHPGRSGPARPKLVVILVVDQMRADYIDKFRGQWSKGLRRLLKQGAWFRQAAYPYLNTVTCAGHATISTGAFPSTHGMVLNAWWERASGAERSCTEDESSPVISYGRAAKGGHSVARLLVPTFADELRTQMGTPTRIVTLSLKARTAIMLAGHRADAVTWADGAASSWVTSSAYTSSPVPFMAEFIRAHPMENDFGKSWTRALPETAYLFQDDAPGEKPPRGWTAIFPHLLEGQDGKPDAGFYAKWATSPFSDEYLGRMAEAAVDALGLGKGPGTDFLGVSFSALDLVGHDFGPRSHEVQDVLIRLDATLGGLLAHMDRAVGRGNYIVAFSSDHGVAPIAEQMTREGLDAGRIVTNQVTERVEKALEPFFSAGKPAQDNLAQTGDGSLAGKPAQDNLAQTGDGSLAGKPAQDNLAQTGDGSLAGRPAQDKVELTGKGSLAGRFVARMAYTDLYFAPGVYEKLEADSHAMQAVEDAILAVPGVLRVYRGEELSNRRASDDPIERAAALSYYPGRSGDLIVVPKPDWYFVNASTEVPPGPATTHGTAYSYDARVPVILMGPGIQPGEYLGASTPADIAPTLAFLCGITLARSDGRVLAETLTPARSGLVAGPHRAQATRVSPAR